MKEYTKIRQFYAWVGFIVLLLVAIIGTYFIFDYVSGMEISGGNEVNYQSNN